MNTPLGETLKRTFTEFKEDQLTDRAAALTYYGVLSIFPALIALVSIVGLVGDPATVTNTLTDVVGSIGPASAVETFKGPIEGITKNSGAAGVLLIVGIASALWTASGYVGAFMRAANVIYEVEEGRSLVKLRPLQMLVTLVLNAERERSRQLEAGAPGAERELQLDERSEPKTKRRMRTA